MRRRCSSAAASDTPTWTSPMRSPASMTGAVNCASAVCAGNCGGAPKPGM